MLIASGTTATMSMSSNVRPWLWEMMDFGCGVDEGRTLFIPETTTLLSILKVVSTNSNNLHTIKTISTGWTPRLKPAKEFVIVKVIDRHQAPSREPEYLGVDEYGDEYWISFRDFISADGTATAAWLEYASVEDLKQDYSRFKCSKLKVLPTSSPDISPTPRRCARSIIYAAEGAKLSLWRGSSVC